MARGAVLSPDSGVTITLLAQPDAPTQRIFGGSGKVVFGANTVRALAEWWGAKADGSTDDSEALQAAYDAIVGSGQAMLHLLGTYGIKRAIMLAPGGTIMSESDATFVAVHGNTQGISISPGSIAYKMVLPHLRGFSDFCLRLYGVDLAMLQLQTLTDCGDAIRFVAWPGGDGGTVLDNTVWFDTILNAKNAIAFAPSPTCDASCVMQGNHVIGGAITGGSVSGQSSAIAFTHSGTGSLPSWDSNQFQIDKITPPSNNADYAVVYDTRIAARQVFRIGSLDILAQGATVFEGEFNYARVVLGLTTQLREGALNLVGQLNLIEFSGATTPASMNTVVDVSLTNNNKNNFNGGQALVSNYQAMRVTPTTDWGPGVQLPVYLYHQLSTGALYQIKCDAPVYQSTGLPIIECARATDNSDGFFIQATDYEVVLWLINLTGDTIKAGTPVPFSISVATLGSTS